MDFRILGALEVRDGGRPLRLTGTKQRAVLALLLLHANKVVSGDRLLDELWSDGLPKTGIHALHGRVSRLRKALGPALDERLLTRPSGYLLRVEPEELDSDRFERLLAQGREAFARGDAAGSRDALRASLALWRGPALADFLYDPFAQAEIARLEELRLVALEERIDADLALEGHAELAGELEALVREHPLRERLRAQLMLALYRFGRRFGTR